MDCKCIPCPRLTDTNKYQSYIDMMPQNCLVRSLGRLQPSLTPLYGNGVQTSRPETLSQSLRSPLLGSPLIECKFSKLRFRLSIYSHRELRHRNPSNFCEISYVFDTSVDESLHDHILVRIRLAFNILSSR